MSLPKRIRLSDERRQELIEELSAFHLELTDEELSEFRAERLLEWFVKSLGPPVYNQAIQDARSYMQDRLDDLDAEFYEPEPKD